MEKAKSKSTGRTLQPFVEALQVGDPIGHANLTLVPLRGGKNGQLDYLLGADAIGKGLLTITEISEGGSVPQLLAFNQSDKMILLMDGEELVGAKQNRILNTTVLLPANSKTQIPVSCVEQGRWHQVSSAFSSGHHSPSSLRAMKSRDVSRNLKACGIAASDQGAVWDAVARNSAELCASSPTGALHDVYEQRQDLFAAYVEALKYPGDACGVMVAIGGVFVAMDLFDRAESLQRIWPRLISGYAMDALGQRKDKGKPKAFTPKGAAALLEHIGEIACDPCPSVGVGEDWRFEAQDVLGQALVAEKVCVHLCAFPNQGTDESQKPYPPIQPPSRRRRGHHGDDQIVY